MNDQPLNDQLEPPKPIEDPSLIEDPHVIQQPNRSTPLGALFLFVAVCSVLVGMIVPGFAAIQESSVALVETIVLIVLGMGGGSVIGFLIGLLFEDRVGAALIGSLVGAASGFVATLMSMAKDTSTPSAFLTAVIGSIVVLVCAFIMRQRSKSETRN